MLRKTLAGLEKKAQKNQDVLLAQIDRTAETTMLPVAPMAFLPISSTTKIIAVHEELHKTKKYYKACMRVAGGRKQEIRMLRKKLAGLEKKAQENQDVLLGQIDRTAEVRQNDNSQDAELRPDGTVDWVQFMNSDD